MTAAGTDPVTTQSTTLEADPSAAPRDLPPPPMRGQHDAEWPDVPFGPLTPDLPTVEASGLTPPSDEPPLKRLGLDPTGIASIESITLLAFKEEQRVEIWIRAMGDVLRKQKEFPFTAFSGGLGPKLREGDGQIPEGIYRIEYLNPNSSYHLSLKIDYPNAFDRRMARRDGRTRLGGDIFLHGKDVTIGCIPLGNPAIEEVFELVSLVGKERVTVVIAPQDFRTRPTTVEIENIRWESELYREIAAALRQFAASSTP